MRSTSMYKMLTSRSYDLPDDVFEAGEVKPAKKKKAKVAKPTAEPSSKKRTVDEANMDVCILWRGTMRTAAKSHLSMTGRDDSLTNLQDSSAAQAAKRRQSGSHAGSNGVNGGTPAGVTT